MLKYLEASVLLSAIYFEMLSRKVKWIEEWVIIAMQSKECVGNILIIKIQMVGRWVFVINVLKLCFMFENFSTVVEKLLLR